MLIAVFATGASGCGSSEPSESAVQDARPPLAIPNDSVTPGESSDESPTGSTGSTGDTGTDTGGNTDSGTGGTTDNNTGGTDTGNNGTGNNTTGGGQQFDQFCQENPGACGD